jgi:2',3'-cyclic-nucleotide 2'-phosphodiesterase (5'-nucleotidase family)
MVLGGRDFDYGTAALEKNLKGLKITALAANILLKKGATPLFTPATYVIPLETGCRVGLVGLTSSEGGSSPANLEFTDPIEAADNYIGDLSEQSEVQIALTHIGIAKDAELAGKVPDLDLILGSADPASKGAGHCSDVGKTPVCRTPPNGTHLGRIDIVISGNKAVIERKELIPADKKAGKYKEIRGLINSYVNRL